MGHNASLQIFEKQERATNNEDSVSPEKFTRLDSSIYVIDESKANHPINAVATKQASSLEKSVLNGRHIEKYMTASSIRLEEWKRVERFASTKRGRPLNQSLNYRADDEDGTCKEEYEHKKAALEAEKQQLREEIDRLTARSTSNLDRPESREHEFKGRINILEAEIQQLKDENHKLLTRLSEIGAVRLTKNNPNIADLSDANRPLKLAEQISELYNNEWTHAFEYLTQTEGLHDEETVRRLLNILKKIYKICLKFTRKQTEDLNKAILAYLGLSEENKTDITVEEAEKRLREYRSKQLEPTLGCVIKDIKDQLKDELEGKVHDTLDKYIQKCTRLCWFMGIKKPQMHLDFYRSQRKGTPEDDANDFRSHFDTTKFVSYTKFGMYVEYIVWPAVCLYKDGPIIKKGVAQGLNTKPEVQKPNVQKNGDASSNIDEKIVIDVDQGHDGDNSKSDITKDKDEDDDISRCLPYADDAVHNTVSENTVHLNSLNFDGHVLSNEKEDDVSLDENMDARISDDSCQNEGLSNATKESKEDETFRSQDESDTDELIFGNDDNKEKSAFASCKG